MVRRWTLMAATPVAVAGIVAGGFAVLANSTAGKPTSTSLVLCGSGTVGANEASGASNQDHPDGSTFMVTEEPAGTSCMSGNSAPGTDTWSILHSNVDTVTERGTEHGEFALSSDGNREAGFDGHITEYDLPSGDSCTSSGRTVDYQSGRATDCTPSFGPVGNFNTHGGAATGDHFRGKYGTIIFQQNSNTDTNCPVGSPKYCIEVDLDGQTN